MIHDGINPYTEVAANTLGFGSFITEKVMKVLSPKEKLKRFNNRVGKHQWSFNDGPVQVAVRANPCISCGKDIQAITAVYGRVITNKFEVTQEGTNNQNIPYKRIYGVPVYKTGFSCKSCFDSLWSDVYYDDKLVKHRGIEILDRPVTKTTETITKNHRTTIRTVPVSRPVPMTRDDYIDRGKGNKKSVSVILFDKQGNEEEWKSTLAPEKVDTEVDAKAYRYFNRQRERSSRNLLHSA